MFNGQFRFSENLMCEKICENYFHQESTMAYVQLSSV